MMFNNKFNFFIHFFILFSFIVFESKAVDEFDINLLNEKLNRLEEEISDISNSNRFNFSVIKFISNSSTAYTLIVKKRNRKKLKILYL